MCSVHRAVRDPFEPFYDLECAVYVILIVEPEKSCLGATDQTQSSANTRTTDAECIKKRANLDPKQSRGGQVRVSAASPSRRSDHVRVLFSARTLLFLVDPEKSSLGAPLPQRRIVAQIRRTKHNRRPYTRATGADSSGSF